MVWFVLIIGYLAVAFCLATLAQPQILRRFIQVLSTGSRLYLAGLLRLIFGVVLLCLATQARLWGYVVTIGVISTASGLSLFFLALRRTKKILTRLSQQSNLWLRTYAIVAMTIWLVLLWAILPL